EFDKITWRASLVYEPTDVVNLYATASTGYRAGGLQLNNPVRPEFDPEFMTNYEIGAKAFLLNRRVNVNLAAFHMDWEDIQILVNDLTTGEQFTDNAATGEARGFELDAQALATEHLSFSLGASFVDTELSFQDAADPRQGSPFPDTPEWKINFNADYQRPVFGQVDGFTRASFIYRDSQIDGLVEEGSAAPITIDGYERVDLRVGLVRPNDWRLEVYGENILDEIYATGASRSAFSLAGELIATEPRRIGARFRKSF
ncbi:MAG: TonB-dependent receptor, partial [Caulobacterales bacterium]|nr:TonB-dependent receptor [Caulobacterales bacterium]